MAEHSDLGHRGIESKDPVAEQSGLGRQDIESKGPAAAPHTVLGYNHIDLGPYIAGCRDRYTLARTEQIPAHTEQG